MHIAVDARPLHHPLSGIGRYTLQLLQAMVAAGGHRWLLIGAPVLPASLQRADVTAVPLTRANPLAFSRLLRATVGGRRPDVLWSPRHHLPALDLPMVVTVHDLNWRRKPTTMRASRWLSEALSMPPSLRRARTVIAVSEHTAQDLRRSFPAAAPRVAVIHPGADHLPRPPLAGGASPPPPSILFVGTFEPRKNLPRLLQAFRRGVDEGRRSHRLVLAGQPGWRVDPAALVHRFELDGLVDIAAGVDDGQLAQLYAAADFLALPSLYEGFGLPIAEALTFGKPVLTSTVSSMPEVAGDAGLLVNPYDVADIARGLGRLMLDRELHQRLSIHAAARADRFRWADAGAATLHALERAC